MVIYLYKLVILSYFRMVHVFCTKGPLFFCHFLTPIQIKTPNPTLVEIKTETIKTWVVHIYLESRHTCK